MVKLHANACNFLRNDNDAQRLALMSGKDKCPYELDISVM